MRKGYKLAAILLFLVAPLSLIAYKVFGLGYSFDHVVPWRGYSVVLDLKFEGHGDSLDIRTFLPVGEKRQRIWEERVESDSLSQYIRIDSAGNRIVNLSSGAISGSRRVRIGYKVLAERLTFALEPDIGTESVLGAESGSTLDSTRMLPVGHLEIRGLLERIAPDRDRMVPLLNAVFTYAVDSIRYRNFSGSTDALTALRLGEASCNGKSRLMVTLLRTAGVPARLVGGLILTGTSKRTSHQWVEAFVSGHWVPFCPTNRHFAEIPGNYLALYRGDEVLFKHTSNINFDYEFQIEPILVGKEEIGLGREQLGAIMRIWEVFDRVGLDIGVLKVLLLIPIGGFVTVLFRNIVGLEPFGTFLPALIASSSKETGLAWGMGSFFLVIGICAILRGVLEGFKITHTPKLAIIMIFVVACMLSLTYAGLTLDMRQIAYVSLFPIVVLTMTVERFSRTVVEDGMSAALKRSLVTALAILCCYAVMSLKVLPLILMAFPEALLILVALNLWVGRWAGIRIMEYWRFRHFLFRGKGWQTPDIKGQK
ncbi:MAG: transglutaminase [Fibrobacterota bacterium]|nr:transglutaminase [Fibrobacterota bacterium]